MFARALYHPQQENPYADIFGENLWLKFEVFQLKQIMRKSEKDFQMALHNLARGKLTSKDLKIFKSRTFSSLPHDKTFKNAIHLFARNEGVNQFNESHLRRITGPEITCEASDIIHGHGSELAKRQILFSVKNNPIHKTM